MENCIDVSIQPKAKIRQRQDSNENIENYARSVSCKTVSIDIYRVLSDAISIDIPRGLLRERNICTLVQVSCVIFLGQILSISWTFSSLKY